ncbi:tetratricopeptide repeat protein [Actinomadura barringtoniae]|uniref:Tetratricopeptide repeat protein n=1 Tax=Actinomadura barringtoniae TaxID=1427535 RepID=A0A939P9A3_9ACTN|nr:tetratricopeptide repeat protein [Actinomadura barringtoniae]MBO2448346.1 tetratricopeptide repeat protein [Actinomadura barringtoniae]
MAAQAELDLLRSFCADLRSLWVEAGGPSLRALERHLSLSKSQVGAILNGRIRRPPDWQVVSTLVECINRHAAEHGRAERLSLRTGVEEHWRPRHGLLEHAFGNAAVRGPEERVAQASPVVPAMLPPAVAGFAGRRELLAVLDDLLASRAELGPAVLITAVGGTAGVGKTALAVHWAHRVADDFPDGQLYVNLRGFDPGGAALGPSEALRGFLNALGVAAERTPDDLTGQIGLYRSLMAGRRMLIVLDNARDVDQVRPLLPGGVGSMVVVTSRNRLTPLVVTEGARSVSLDLLSGEEARELLERRLGRPLADDGSVEEIIARCARLPLALAVVAARAATDPNLPLSRLAAELRDRAGALDTLQGGDAATDVRAVFSWSYRSLSLEAARLFRLLGLHPSADFGAAVAISLAGDPPSVTRAALGELTRAHLVAERSPGRYEFHDLLRAYAAEQAAAGDEQGSAVHRMLDHYVHTAHQAGVLMDPHRYVGDSPDEPESGVAPEELGEAEAALDWFGKEYRTLLAAIDQAAESGFALHAWQLARAMTNYQYRRGHWHELIASHRVALTSAEQAGDLLGQAHAWRGIANALWSLGRLDESRVGMEAALELFGQVDDHDGMGVMQENLAWAAWHVGDPTDALVHARQSLALHRGTGRLAGQARALGTIGWVLVQLGDPVEAIRQCEQALEPQLRLGDTFGLANTWEILGLAHAGARDHGEAARCHRRALELFRATGHLAGQAGALDNIGDALQATGDVAAAQAAWSEAIAIFEEFADSEAARVRAKLDQRALVSGAVRQ